MFLNEPINSLPHELYFQTLHCVIGNTDRQNIFFDVQKRHANVSSKGGSEHSVTSVLQPIGNELLLQKGQCQKTIIFAKLK